MVEENENRARPGVEHGGDRLYFIEAIRFLDDACNGWRALALRWTDAGDYQRAADALKHVQRCELQRRRMLATLDEIES